MRPFIQKTAVGSTIFLIALIIRIEYNNHTIIIQPLIHDDQKYVFYAMNIIHFGVYSQSPPSSQIQPDTAGTPGYPLFLSAIFATSPNFNTGYERIITWQIFLDAVTVVLVFFLSLLFLPFRFAVIASLLTCFSPHLISATSYVLTETLFTFLLTLSIALLILGIETSKKANFLFASLFMGAASLVRPSILLFPIFLIPMVLFYWRPLQKYRISILLLIGLAFLWAPWSIYSNKINSNIENRQSSSLASFVFGSYPELIFKSKFKQSIQGYPYSEDPEYNRMTRDFSFAMRTIRGRVFQEPIKYLKWYGWGKLRMFWSWDEFAGGGDVYIYPVLTSLFITNKTAKLIHSGMKALHPLLLLLIVIGIPFVIAKSSQKEKRQITCALIILILILYFSIVHILLGPLPRYAIPMRPFLYIGATVSLHFLWEYSKSIFNFGGIDAARRSFSPNDQTR